MRELDSVWLYIGRVEKSPKVDFILILGLLLKFFSCRNVTLDDLVITRWSKDVTPQNKLTRPCCNSSMIVVHQSYDALQLQ